MWKAVEKAFNWADLPVELSRADAALEPEFLRIYAACKEFTMTSRARMYALYQATKFVVQAKIPGALAECGVWRGGSMMLVARTLVDLAATDRTLYLYDTFEGMSRPSEHDVTLRGGHAALPEWERHRRGVMDRLRKLFYRHWYEGGLDAVRRNLASTGYPADRIVYVPGKVEDTLPGTGPEQLALLRLDTDWYESTKHELECLYPRLAARGILIIDDYGYWAGAKQAVDEYFAGRTPQFLTRIDWTGRMLSKTELT